MFLAGDLSFDIFAPNPSLGIPAPNTPYGSGAGMFKTVPFISKEDGIAWAKKGASKATPPLLDKNSKLPDPSSTTDPAGGANQSFDLTRWLGESVYVGGRYWKRQELVGIAVGGLLLVALLTSGKRTATLIMAPAGK